MRHAGLAALAAFVLGGMTMGIPLPAHGQASPLDGSAWVLASLGGKAPLPGEPPTARFATGRLQGSDGCNRYILPYATSGSAGIAFGAATGATTLRACAPEVESQARAFRAALAGATSFRREAETLQLLASDGTVLAGFAAQSEALAGTAWRAIAINNGRGAVVSLVDGTTVTLEFAADGSVAGDAGCNRYRASFTAKGRDLRFTAPMATRRMCTAAGVMEQEQAFLRALETVATMSVEGDRLEMRTADDALALMLERERKP